MPKYLFSGTYAAEGVTGLLKEGGSGRADAVRALTESLGGRVECLYFAFGKHDIHVVVDLPDNVSAASLALTVAAVGLVSLDTTVLLTAAEIDEAAQRHPDYRAPGG